MRYLKPTKLKLIFFVLVTIIFVESFFLALYLIPSNDDEMDLGQEDVLINLDRTVLSNDDVISKIEEAFPNVIISHIYGGGPSYNSSCGLYANALDIHYSNIYWQMQKTKDETFYLYAAYYDERPAANGRYIRISAMVDRFSDSGYEAHCLMWFGDEKPAISPVFQSLSMWHDDWGRPKEVLTPFLLSCEVPAEYENRVPDSVSLVGHPCDRATNNLKVMYNPAPNDEKKDFVVCVKGLNFEHNSNMAIRLVEWIELLKILGADKIDFYQYFVHENITRILDHYKHRKDIEVIKMSFPGHYPHMQHFMTTLIRMQPNIKVFLEMIHYNDCLYKNLYKYRYVVLLDVDEVIVPRGDLLTWRQLLDATLPKAFAADRTIHSAFSVRNVLFMDDKKELNDWHLNIPKYMHMLQHVRRNKYHEIQGYGIKAFHNTDLVISLHNHYPRACFKHKKLWCRNFDIDVEDAHLQHYCYGRGKRECKTVFSGNLTLDTNIWKYKPELIRSVKKTLKETGFLNKARSNKIDS